MAVLRKLDRWYTLGCFSGLIPCWVNAPSTLQPAHKYHGQNMVAVHFDDGGYICCPIDAEEPITIQLPENTKLEPGWRNKKQ